MMFSSVLLPEPDGPTTAADSPRPISSVMSRYTETASAPVGDSYRFVTSVSFSNGDGMTQF